MALEGPQIRYTRMDDDHDAAIAQALELSRRIELLLEAVPESGPGMAARAHSTRMARAMAASLVDELEALVRGRRRGDVASG